MDPCPDPTRRRLIYFVFSNAHILVGFHDMHETVDDASDVVIEACLYVGRRIAPVQAARM